MNFELLIVNKIEQTSCCDSLRSFEGAVSPLAYLGFIIKTASLENIRRYWIDSSTSFSSRPFQKKPSTKPSFWNFVQSNGAKYPESPTIFNRSEIEKR